MDLHYLDLSVALSSQRKTGYKKTDNAIYELVDNSVQAGLKNNKNSTDITLITIEKPKTPGSAQYYINSIAVLDNAGGMEKDVLHKAVAVGHGEHREIKNQKGMGKYGIGLFNSSISQCNITNLYSWQKDKCYFNYIDCYKLTTPKNLIVEEPVEKEIPHFYLEYFSEEISKNNGGTIIEWKELEDISWKTSDGFFNNASFLIGRAYRKFLLKDKIKIKFVSFRTNNDKEFEVYKSEYIKPVDPMYLMEKTNTPAPYDKKPAWIHFGSEKLTYEHVKGDYKGIESEITLNFSIANIDARNEGGSSPLGRHAKKNMGVSVLRADRELEMNTTWIKDDTRARWVSAEINFPPEMDEIFGVPNNKQYAGNLEKIDEEDFLDSNNISSKSKLSEYLSEQPEENIRYLISQILEKNISAMIASIRKMREKSNTKNPRAEKIGTDENKKRSQKGDKSTSDDEFSNSDDKQKFSALFEQFRQSGYSEEESKEKSELNIKRKLQYQFIKRSMGSPQLFDITSEAGIIIIYINSLHPGYEHLYEIIDQADGEQSNEESPAMIGLKLLFESWARMEDEATPEQREVLQEVRIDWGKISKQFFEALNK
tara:strand:+ start:644 stop:2434 length:1791 start_codon:yes stop_codon:yes gene_type:complete